MANTAQETVVYPFTSFNFAVEINVTGGSTKVCSAAFSECDGLEMTMDVKTIREGGNNATQIRLTGPVSYGQLTLKRGMTANFELWDWFTSTLSNARQRADAEVVIFAADGSTERVRFVLTRCLPVKLKAPALNAKDGMVAIEELQLAYESLALKRPSGGGGGAAPGAPGGPGLGFSAGISAGVSIGGSAGFSAGASVSASGNVSAGASGGASAEISIG